MGARFRLPGFRRSGAAVDAWLERSRSGRRAALVLGATLGLLGAIFLATVLVLVLPMFGLLAETGGDVASVAMVILMTTGFLALGGLLVLAGWRLGGESRERDRRAAALRARRCPECDYDIRAARAPRCPECGSDLPEPANP